MNRNTFYVSCPIDCYSGYSSRSRDFVKALIELDKYDVKIIPQRWGNTPFGFIDDHIEEWGFLKNYIHQGPLTKQPDIWSQITIPSEFQPIGKYNLGITAGIESTVCNPTWIQGCNKMDLTLVSSTHSKNVFENSKFTVSDNGVNTNLSLSKPIEVLKEGINIEQFMPTSTFKSNELYETLNKIPEQFCFLFVGHWLSGDIGHDRKNIGLLIKSFYETFKNKKKKPALILKTSGASSSYTDRYEIQKRIDIIKKSVPSKDLPSIYLLHGEFSDLEINELYNHPKVKAMVSLTKGEGFGRPLLEFSLTNKPIMASGWSGHTDFLKPDMSALLGGTLSNVHPSAANDFLIKESQWFNVDPTQIGLFFIDIFENYKKWKEKGKRQGFYSRKNFSFQNMKNKLSDLIDKYIPNIPVETQLKLPQLKRIELPSLKKIETNDK
jgi:glycosyltransferase involved in cell wall biosynthesis